MTERDATPAPTFAQTHFLREWHQFHVEIGRIAHRLRQALNTPCKRFAVAYSSLSHRAHVAQGAI